MSANYISLNGTIIDKNDLRISKAQQIVRAIENLPFYSLIEIRKIDELTSAEIIVFDAEVEIGQRVHHDIRGIERIAAVFTSEDNATPEVLALREDFPQVPHLNPGLFEMPRSLCLFEERYAELKLSWTPTYFLESIRKWLALTARGELHQEDQPLELLLLGVTRKLIIPNDLFIKKGSSEFEILIIRRAVYGKNDFTLIAERKAEIQKRQKEIEFISIQFQGEPQTHGILSWAPSNLFDLHNFLERANIDLLSDLRNILLTMFETGKSNCENLLDAELILIVNLPKRRHENDDTESTDIWAFWLQKSVKEIGVEIGIWDITDGKIGALVPQDKNKNGNNVDTGLLNPILTFSREIASIASGITKLERKNIVLIGTGALGSQFFLNLVRMGYGNWTLIDEDCLLPHNLARHALGGYHVGYSKAERLSLEANMMIKDQNIADAIVADVLNPTYSLDELESIYEKADVIIDASTSLAVARYLTHDIGCSARRISVFLNPSGTDVIILAEDKDRMATLDALEMQYYRHLINEPEFIDHLQRDDGLIRYARSCRDVSNIIPQDLVALHAAICSRGIRNILSNDSGCISIWKADINDLSVRSYNVSVSNPSKLKIDGWTLYFDDEVLNKVFEAREVRLPNETGGILIGSYDVQRRIVYVIDTILSPPDSKEYPNAYIRGCKGLKERVDEIQQVTLEMLKYVGEWHSHPKGHNTKPSSDDMKLFNWLDEHFSIDGLPPLMLIVGDQPNHTWYLGKSA